MSKYKQKDHLKTFYFVLPVKQNGYPDLTAWTDNEYLARSYAEQYRDLEPVILCCQGTSITDPDVKRFVKENLNMEMGHDFKISAYKIAEFRNSDSLGESEKYETFLMTNEQEVAVGEQWSYTTDQLYDMFGSAVISIFHMSRFITDDKFRKIFGYICSKYIIRILICLSGDINDLSDEARRKLSLPTLKDCDCIYECDIYDQYYLDMILLRHMSRILDRDRGIDR